jgi:AcrR family transcriptional regulator
MSPTKKQAPKKQNGSRSKSDAIIAAAISVFGEFGYETTKWSSVADRVGIGQTALYHYFESKAHCLLTIMRLQLEHDNELFLGATKDLAPKDAIRAAIKTAYDHDEHGVLQVKILHRHMDLLAYPRASEREENERLEARQLVREIEQNWINLIDEGMKSGEFVKEDSVLTGRTVLGLVLSVWNWYNPKKANGKRSSSYYSLEQLSNNISNDVLTILTTK